MTNFRLPGRHPAFQAQNGLRRSRWRIWLIVFGLLVLFAGFGIGGWLIWQKIHDNKPIPHNLLKGLQYQVYYPYHLPAGYEVNLQSFSRKDTVLIFSIRQLSNNKSIAVTEEAKPTGINLDAQSLVPLPTDRNFYTPVGHATITQWNVNTVSSLVTDQTWVILNVSGIDPAQAQAVTSSFIKL